MIEKRIKERFGTKGNFCAKCGHKPKELATKLKTLRNKLAWMDKFLAPLGLRVTIVEDYETVKGIVKGVNTEGFSEGEVVYYTNDLIGDSTPAEPQGLSCAAKDYASPVTGEVQAVAKMGPDDLIGEEARAKGGYYPCCGEPVRRGKHKFWCSGPI